MKSRPWTAYFLRILCCLLMFLSGYALLAGSTFALRMRNDLPVLAMVLALSGTFALLPLAAGRGYLGALLASAFVLSGLGGYWWTTIPWDELIKDSGFPTTLKPDLLDFALVASPAVVAAFYAVMSRPSLLWADLKCRGADRDEIWRASVASFFSGTILLVVCGALSVALWAFMASGLASVALAPIPTGLPAIVLVGALVTVACALLARRLPRFRIGRTVRANDAATEAKPGLVARMLAWRKAPS